MAAYITVLNYVYSLCVFYYSVLSCVADVDCPLQCLSATVIKNIIIIIMSDYYYYYYYYYYSYKDVLLNRV